MKRYRVTFTIDVNSRNKEESFERSKYQLKHKDYDMNQINIQSSELTADENDEDYPEGMVINGRDQYGRIE